MAAVVRGRWRREHVAADLADVQDSRCTGVGDVLPESRRRELPRQAEGAGCSACVAQAGEERGAVEEREAAVYA